MRFSDKKLKRILLLFAPIIILALVVPVAKYSALRKTKLAFRYVENSNLLNEDKFQGFEIDSSSVSYESTATSTFVEVCYRKGVDSLWVKIDIKNSTARNPIFYIKKDSTYRRYNRSF